MTKVFISCGQASPEEVNIAVGIKGWLEENGFEAYVAKEVHSFEDTKKSIILELENSDYYLFIDFKRERICEPESGLKFRGSLFSHQELALASYIGFENTIFLKERDVERNGFLGYILSNPIEFSSKNEIIELVKKEVKEHNWENSYSRHLIPREIYENGRSEPCFYRDQQGQTHQEIIWSCRIHNRNSNRDARNVTAILLSIQEANDKTKKAYVDGRYLKWAGHFLCYEQTILRRNSRNVDLLSIQIDSPLDIFLHDDNDAFPRKPINNRIKGVVFLEYGIYAQNFPERKFVVKVDLTGNISTTKAELHEGIM